MHRVLILNWIHLFFVHWLMQTQTRCLKPLLLYCMLTFTVKAIYTNSDKNNLSAEELNKISNSHNHYEEYFSGMEEDLDKNNHVKIRTDNKEINKSFKLQSTMNFSAKIADNQHHHIKDHQHYGKDGLLHHHHAHGNYMKHHDHKIGKNLNKSSFKSQGKIPMSNEWKLKQLSKRFKGRHANFIKSYKTRFRLKKFMERRLFKNCMANEADADPRCNRFAFNCVFCN